MRSWPAWLLIAGCVSTREDTTTSSPMIDAVDLASDCTEARIHGSDFVAPVGIHARCEPQPCDVVITTQSSHEIDIRFVEPPTCGDIAFGLELELTNADGPSVGYGSVH